MTSSKNPERSFPHPPYTPFDPSIAEYDCAGWHGFSAVPWEFGGWRKEILAWKKSVGIHAGLNPTPTSILRGPDVVRFLSDSCVNSFARFPIGGSKHAIMVNDNGHVMMHGVVLHLAENEVMAMWLSPWLDYLLNREPGKYDVQLKDITPRHFLFQIAGPQSLQTIEGATGESLRDIAFLRHRMSSIAGKKVRILRLGMAGGLAYEVHGETEEAIEIYKAIMEAGKGFGIERMGFKAYMLNHTEGGFPQFGLHFPPAWAEDEGFMAFMGSATGDEYVEPVTPRGSAGFEPHFYDPFELGWSGMVKFDHEFVGRAALEAIAQNPQRKMVTLEWNEEDILDVHRSQLEPGEPYLPMDQPGMYSFWPGGPDQNPALWNDLIKSKEGTIIGLSSGRTHSMYFRKMLSLGSIDVDFAQEGKELIVVWGEPGTRQKEVRVKVARFPYMGENRNEKIDVSKLPSCSAR